MIVLCFSMQRGDIIEHIIEKCHIFILVCKRKIFFNILLSSVICVHF